jgi:UPF0755 protein
MNFVSISEHVSRRLPWIAAILIVLILLFVGISWYRLNSPLSLDTAESFEVFPGNSLNQVSNELTNLGYLNAPLLFTSWARLTGKASQIKAGEYELISPTTPLQLLDKLVAGDIIQYQLTLVEGWTLQQALEAIWSAPGIIESLKTLSTSDIARVMQLEYPNAEGLFFPDTYFYSKGTQDTEILVRAHEQLKTILEQSWSDRLGALPYESAYEALIMASIIEKESAASSERGHIAGVFIRRLENGMRLQSDPTVIYGLGGRYDGNISRSSLEEATAYNTYRINGLPPTPIALAGRESIEASLNPISSSYLYFVSKGDGSHYFSSTLEEHNAAVRQYQLNELN